MRRTLTMTLLLLAVLLPRAAAQEPPTRLLLVVDCSQSMWDHWQSGPKIKVTQQVLLSFLDSVGRRRDVDVALRVFGHLNKDAIGTRLEVPFGEDNNYRLQSKIKTLVPNGGCTAAAALTDALGDFPATSRSRNLILIITDGTDSREAEGARGANGLADEICEVARQVQLSGVVVQTFVLGIGDGSFRQADCAGSLFPVPHEEDFARTLYDIFRLSGHKAQVVLRLTDASGQCHETELPVALHDHRTGVLRHSTLYSVGPDLRPDTLLLDPLVSYDLTLFTRPPLRREALQFGIGQPTRLDIAAAEGSLRVAYSGPRSMAGGQGAEVVVRQAGAGGRVATQQVGEEASYLAGRYDVEVQTLPPTLFSGVEVRAGATAELAVPAPGQLQLAKPKGITTGAILRIDNGQATFAADLNPSTAGERLMLQPGEYELVLHPYGATDYGQVQTRRFRIESGQVTKLQF